MFRKERTAGSRRRIRSFLIVILVLVVWLSIDIYRSANDLTVSNYEIESKNLPEHIRIVQLSDLHDSEFGENNENLIQKVKEQKPDIICITGDLVDMKEDRIDIGTKLIQGLATIAPVYVSLGNHEYGYSYLSLEEVIRQYEMAGATVVDGSYVDVQIRGMDFRIGGYYGYGSPDKDPKSDNEHTLFLREFQNTDRSKLLLCHMPLSWYAAGSLDFWDVDLVLCGHTHGGQIRIPLIGGLYAPDLSYWPGREKGIYDSADGSRHMVLTTGLGNTEKVPRINNLPEILVIDYGTK